MLTSFVNSQWPLLVSAFVICGLLLAAVLLLFSVNPRD